MAAGIFNGGMYHGFTVGDDGTLYERYGNPPTSWNPVPNTAARLRPRSEVSVRRITKDTGEVIYPGAYFVVAQAQGDGTGSDIVIAVWANGWSVYGG